MRRATLSAPRGKYPRGLDRAARESAHRDRIERAALWLVAEGAVTVDVDAITRSIACGRRTFYAHYRDVAHTFACIDRRLSHDLEARIDAAEVDVSTPRTRWRAVVDAVLAWSDEDAARAPYAARREPDAPWLRDVLTRSAGRCANDGVEVGIVAAAARSALICVLAGGLNHALVADPRPRAASLREVFDRYW